MPGVRREARPDLPFPPGLHLEGVPKWIPRALTGLSGDRSPWAEAEPRKYNQNQMIVLSGLPSYVNWHWLWLTVAAFLDGLLNAVAGGGSFLLFPAMLGMKMLPIQANATNTVALWPGQLTSIAAYREDIRKNLRLAFTMGLAGFLGGTVGAIVLLNTPQKTFLQLVPWLLLVAASIFAVSGPVSRWLERRKRTTTPGHPGGCSRYSFAPSWFVSISGILAQVRGF